MAGSSLLLLLTALAPDPSAEDGDAPAAQVAEAPSDAPEASEPVEEPAADEPADPPATTPEPSSSPAGFGGFADAGGNDDPNDGDDVLDDSGDALDDPPNLEDLFSPPSAADEPVPGIASSDRAAAASPNQPGRPVPRVLSTIAGNPPDELSYIGRGAVRLQPGVQIRNQVGWVSPFPLDRRGENYDEGVFTTGRFRWNPTLHLGKVVSIVGTLDLINGRWAPVGSEDPTIDAIIEEGQPPGRTELRLADPRELYIELNTAIGLVRVGQQSFTWGQGILANNGNNVDRFGDMRFGDDGPGDIYERVLFLTKPFHNMSGRISDLAIGIGGDLVFRDERVQLTRGDLAGQALFVMRYDSSRNLGNSIGGYAVYRHQENADDGDIYPDDEGLRVGAFDIAGQGTLWLRDRLQLIGAFEGVVVAGKAEFARDERGDHTVVQGGAAARAYIGNHDHWLVGFDTGYASGDADPDDRFINNFTFDQGHTVGLVMFNPVMGWRTAQSEILANDPELTGIPSNGTQFIPTRGGVSNALYIHPKARWSLAERLEVWGGPLLAAAPVPVVDPYAAQLNGGQPTTSLGGDGHKRFYGTELDLGIRGRVDLRGLWLQMGLQGGLLLPGPAMADAQGNTGGPVGAVWFRTEIRY